MGLKEQDEGSNDWPQRQTSIRPASRGVMLLASPQTGQRTVIIIGSSLLSEPNTTAKMIADNATHRPQDPVAARCLMTKIRVLDASKEDLLDDFEAAPQEDLSPLYQGLLSRFRHLWGRAVRDFGR